MSIIYYYIHVTHILFNFDDLLENYIIYIEQSI